MDEDVHAESRLEAEAQHIMVIMELPSELFDLLKVARTNTDYDWILCILSEHPYYQ